MVVRICAIFLSSYVLLSLKTTFSVRVSVPGLQKHECYFKPGDLHLGISYYIHKKGSTDKLCSDTFFTDNPLTRLRDTEVFRFAIDYVNQRPDLLPNISLGFAMVDDCGWDIGALAQAMYFTPLENSNGSMLYSAPTTFTNCSDGMRQFPIVGFTGITNSRKGVMASPFFSVFQIPIVAYYATSDELSDKTRYEYFMRLSPPDRYQVDALLDFAEAFNWTYISLLYSEGSFGENGARLVEKGSQQRGICIAVSYLVESDSEEQTFDKMVEILRRTANSRVVVLFLSFADSMDLMESIDRLDAIGEFIWLGSDALSYYTLIPPANGTFAIHHVSNGVPDWDHFNGYLESLTPENHPENYWIYGVWEEMFGCQWESRDPGSSCQKYANTSISGFTPHERLTVTIDTIETFARGIHHLISEQCPDAFQDRTKLTTCVKGDVLLDYLRNVTFEGRTGTVNFDKNGDMPGRYMIKQHTYLPERVEVEVALWDKGKQKLEINQDDINWGLFEFGQYDSREEGKPLESLCSKPCQVKQYAIRLELECCWECRSCRENEIIVNASRCEMCPENSWPDDETCTECVRIEPDFLQWSDGLSIALTVLTFLGIISWCATLVVYAKNWNAKLIKASSRELSCVILAGILLAYLGVFAYLWTPQETSCHLRRHLFNLSVVFIYAPLLMKTNRVYRIFSAGKRGQKAQMTGSRIQLFFTLVIFFIQIGISFVSAIIVPTSPDLKMPIFTEKYVELYCSLPLEGLLIPLSVNLLLLCLCAIYGFLTRKLPDNFNESWYIFVSVTTTAFLWLVFLPTYFTTYYAYHQAALMAFCLILNASVTLLCLYVPKIYALYFVDENRLSYAGTMNSTAPKTTTTKVSVLAASHRINNLTSVG